MAVCQVVRVTKASATVQYVTTVSPPTGIVKGLAAGSSIAEGGQRLAFADVARLVGVREGRIRQVLGPLRIAHRNATPTSPDSGSR